MLFEPVITMNIRIGNKKEKEFNSVSNHNNSITQITEMSESAEAMQILNDDNLNRDGNFNNIDTRTRLNSLQVSNFGVIDNLINIGFLPKFSLTTVLKRLNMSLDGKSREELVRVAVGKQEEKNERANSVLGTVKNLISQKPGV